MREATTKTSVCGRPSELAGSGSSLLRQWLAEQRELAVEADADLFLNIFVRTRYLDEKERLQRAIGRGIDRTCAKMAGISTKWVRHEMPPEQGARFKLYRERKPSQRPETLRAHQYVVRNGTPQQPRFLSPHWLGWVALPAFLNDFQKSRLRSQLDLFGMLLGGEIDDIMLANQLPIPQPRLVARLVALKAGELTGNLDERTEQKVRCIGKARKGLRSTHELSEAISAAAKAEPTHRYRTRISSIQLFDMARCEELVKYQGNFDRTDAADFTIGEIISAESEWLVRSW